MKNYVKPSIELSKFDTEEILTASGNVGGYSSLTDSSKSIIDSYNTGSSTQKVDTAGSAVEFHW